MTNTSGIAPDLKGIETFEWRFGVVMTPPGAVKKGESLGLRGFGLVTFSLVRAPV